MSIFDSENQFRIEVRAKKESEIQKIEEELTRIKLKKEEEEKAMQTEEYKKQKAEYKADYAKKIVFKYFKKETNRDMTEEEFSEYHALYDKGEKGFNLWRWLESKGLRQPIIEEEKKKDERANNPQLNN